MIDRSPGETQPDRAAERDEVAEVHHEADTSPKHEAGDGGTPEAKGGPPRDILSLAAQGDNQKGEADHDQNKKGEVDPKKQDDNPPAPPPKSVFIIAALVVLALVAWGGYQHWRSYEDSKATAADTTEHPIDVRTTEAKSLDAPIDLSLPGETQAFDTANIFPRATGYISERRVDIGSRVKQGDLLIRIAAPDLDQQLAQAEAQIGQTRASLVQAQAQVSQAEANLNLAKVNFARTNQLTQQGYESQQNRDQRQADLQSQEANVSSAKAGVNVAEANIQAQQATIDRLKALGSFEEVRSPFDGVVTARNVDLGELVNADVSTGQPMFTIVRDNVIRVLVRVPQSAAIGIHQGLEANISVSQMPDRHFSGRVQRSSVALLYSSRTLTTEVDVANENGDLRPGLYVTVNFAIPRDHTEVNIPAEALIFDQHGIRAATVEDGTLQFHPVNIARDHGTSVDLRDGILGGARVVLNAPATVKSGAKVKEIREEDEKKKDEEDERKNEASQKQAKADQGGQAQAKGE